MTDQKSRYVFGAVPYMNAAPLAHFLEELDADAEVIYGHPSVLTEKVLGGVVHAGLVPVVDYFDNPGLKMIDGLGISSDGNVQSVLLKCEQPLDRIRTVSMDPASKTSNMLAELLLRDHFHLSVGMCSTDAAGTADAAVVIGDRALCAPPAPHGDYDLAHEWKAMTGLPFVFAVWACRSDCESHAELSRITHSALERGMATIPELAQLYAERLPISAERCLDYLTNAIRYQLGPREMEAMQLFRTLLKDSSSGIIMCPTDPTIP